MAGGLPAAGYSEGVFRLFVVVLRLLCDVGGHLHLRASDERSRQGKFERRPLDNVKPKAERRPLDDETRPAPKVERRPLDVATGKIDFR